MLIRPVRSVVHACCVAAAAALVAVAAASAEARPPGPLTVGQLHGRDGCVSRTGTGGLCLAAPALDAGSANGAGSVAASPDGRNLYVAAAGRGAVVVVSRDRLTGAVRQSSCVGDGRAGCERGQALAEASAAAVSPDGRNVYVTSAKGRAVAVFSRDAETGSLAQGRCGGGGSPGCAPGRALVGASSVTVSPDGRHVYVAARVSSAVTVFARDPATGSLKELACLSDDGTGGCVPTRALAGARFVALSRDGRLAYVASFDAVLVLARDAASGLLRPRACASADGSDGACAIWPALEGGSSAVPSPDGRHVYVTAAIANSLTAFRVADGGTRLAVAGCVSDEGLIPGCRRGYGLNGAAAASVAPDGRTVYVASGRFSHGLAVFSRDRATGSVRERGCITQDRTGGACAKGAVMEGATTAALSPDGRNVYVLGETADALTVLGPDIGILGRRWRITASGVVRLRLVCPRNARTRCRGLLRLKAVKPMAVRGARRRSATLGSATFSVPRGGRRSLAVRVRRELIPRIRRSGGLRVRPLVFPPG